MRNFLVLFIILASCSAPRYSYYFDHHSYDAGKKKIFSQHHLDDIIPIAPFSNETDPLYASSGNSFIPAGGTTLLPLSENIKRSLKVHSRHDLRKDIHSAIKEYKRKVKENSGAGRAAEGDKNQLITLLMAIFLGWLGLHRFYLGRTGTALAQVGLLVLGLFTLIPLYALAIWILIDIVLIAIDKLTPKNGAYNPQL